jgi:hypothetical protein
MIETFSDDFKKLFLIKFTAELIKHSEKKDIIKLQSIIESKEEKRKKSIPIQNGIVLGEGKRIITNLGKKIPQRNIRIRTREIGRSSLFVPEPKLPQHLEYLRPIPTAGIEIDLGKLNPLIKDPAVRIIEVNPDEKVSVSGRMGTKQTDIILNKEDIDRVINRFSELSKIPVEEGIYRVVVGNMIFSAIISEVIGSKFMIRKMIPVATIQPKPLQQIPPKIQMPLIQQRTINSKNNFVRIQ